MVGKFFEVSYLSKKSSARLGEIKTSHGVIKTPAFVPVATKGSLKSLTPSLIADLKIQTAFVNTYHLTTHPGAEIIVKAGGIHKYANFKIPLMSDSGGFQIFSLARSSVIPAQAGIQNKIDSRLRGNDKREKSPSLVKISDNGVKFRSVFDGKIIEFTPEKSIEFQQMIGADLNMAFDECIPYGSDYNYSKRATERTHRWLIRSIKEFTSLRVNGLKTNPQTRKLAKLKNKQYLYGIVQGGVFEDLRKQSAEFVISQDVDGVAIGGVSVGETKAEMRDQVKWVADYLPKDKPVHLLGVGQIDDIIDLVKYGIDTFDCVEPTRKARMGSLFQNNATEIDILKGSYRYDLSKVDKNCDCYVCQNFTKSYLHHLFKQRELLGYTLATYHNLWVMERLFDKIRESIGLDLI